MVQIFSILNLYILKLFLKLILLISYGRLNGKEVMILTYLKYSSMMLSLLGILNKDYTRSLFKNILESIF